MGTASVKEVALIEKRMAEETEFVEQVEAMERQLLRNPKTAEKMFQKNVSKTLQFKELEGLQQFFGGLQSKLERALNQKTASPLEEMVQYSIEQLKQWFMPLPLYERRIVGVARGGSDLLIAPEKNTDCSNRQLEFVWKAKRGGFEEIDLIVENNRRKVLLEEALDVDAHSATIAFPKETFPPGRYYWKFCIDDEEPIMGVFFIERGLMPT